MPSSVKELLAAANGSVPAISPQDAKALIEKRGWRSGLRQDNNSGGFPIFEYPLCVYDAIVEAGGIGAGGAVQIMRTVIALNGNWRSIMDWNDVHARTLGQVYAAFDRAIAS